MNIRLQGTPTTELEMLSKFMYIKQEARQKPKDFISHPQFYLKGENNLYISFVQLLTLEFLANVG